MKRLRNFLKQIETEFDEPTAEEMAYLNDEVKRYIVNGIIPQDKRAKRLAYQLTKGMKDMVSSNKFPSMPHEQWVIENPDGKCQPLDWVPSPDWKPSPPEPEPVKEKGRLYLVKTGSNE